MFTRLLPTQGLSAAAALALAALLAGPAAQAQTIDGTRDASYPAPLAVQANPTGFGDSGAGMTGGANGDELDNISARIVGSDLFLFIGGNMQSNGTMPGQGNHVEIFFDSKAGGQNVLAAGASGALAALSGLKFDAGFTADYLLSASAQGTSKDAATASFTSLSVNYAVVGGTNSTTPPAGLGLTAASSTPLTLGTATGAAALNNSNTAGVGSYVAGTTGTNGTGTIGTPATVSTGLELRIPLSALGATYNGGDIKICVFINGQAQDYLSNQVLGPLPFGQANLGDGTGGYTGGAAPVAKVDFTAYAGDQFVTVANTSLLATTTAKERAQISVAPNPAQGRVLVQLPATVADLHLTLYNTLGQAVRQLSPSAGATSAAMEAAGLASGVYLLRAQSGSDVLATQRVVLD